MGSDLKESGGWVMSKIGVFGELKNWKKVLGLSAVAYPFAVCEYEWLTTLAGDV